MSNQVDPFTDFPLFRSVKGVEYTTVKTSTFRLSLVVAIIFGIVIGVLLGIPLLWLFDA